MDKIKFFYWAFATTVLIEILNLILKLFSPYYFNLVILAILTFIIALLGKHLGIKVVWVVTICLITLLLVILLTFVVWN